MDELTRLALAAGKGDRLALEMFVRRAQPDVWRFCVHNADPSLLEDVVQETMVRTLSALGGFRAEASARGWLLRIAYYTCADMVRSQRRQRVLLERLTAAPVAPSVLDEVGTVDLDELVRALDPDRRTAFVLTQVLGMSYEEAAHVCGCPIGTIRSRVSRARLDLLRAAKPSTSERTTFSS